MTDDLVKPQRIDLRRSAKMIEDELRGTRHLLLRIRTQMEQAVIEANRAKTAQLRYTYKLTRMEAAIHERLKRIEDFI